MDFSLRGAERTRRRRCRRADSPALVVRNVSCAYIARMTHLTLTNAAPMLADHAGDLRVADTRTLRGPNVWHLAPVIVGELRAGRLADESPSDTVEALERLHVALPAVAPAAGDSWGQLLVRVTMELQRLAGSPADFGRVLKGSPAH